MRFSAFKPARGLTRPPIPINPANVNPLDNIHRSKVTVDMIIPVHYRPDGRKVTMAELTRAIAAEHELTEDGWQWRRIPVGERRPPWTISPGQWVRPYVAKS